MSIKILWLQILCEYACMDQQEIGGGKEYLPEQIEKILSRRREIYRSSLIVSEFCEMMNDILG